VPVAAPLANLLAGPLVSLATVAGAVASVVGSPALAGAGGLAADGVVLVARLVGAMPMIGWGGLAVVVGAAVVWRYLPATRVAIGCILLVAAGVVLTGSGPAPGPWVAFLDVGQGDAALVRGVDGGTVLVDGGPDPVVLAAALRRHGVRHVDLLVVSHRHADHVSGLGAVVGRLPIGRVWYPDHHDLGVLAPVLAELTTLGIPHGTPPIGTVARVGSISLEVLGPVRRYASPNDESLVLRVWLDGLDVVFSGDVEALAQADLGPLAGDVLKVPHHGSATTDLRWLEASAAEVAVISVGPNDFGHPSDDVVGVLRDGGVVVCRTDRDGDVVVVPGGVVGCGGRRAVVP
jgi:competence protein ComEC